MSINSEKKTPGGANALLTGRAARLLALSAIAVGIAVSTGCAGTAPKAQFSREIVPESRISSPDSVQVTVGAADNVAILPTEKERLGERIKSKIDAEKISNPGAGDARAYELDVQLSRYDKGNAFARAMLAGLGQIHIDGKVSVYQIPEHTLVGEFGVAKTFAWGGVYGASTSMEDIEGTFAEGIADAVTGQKKGQPKHADPKSGQ
jgi:Domain of unknown function (DUF4410)